MGEWHLKIFRSHPSAAWYGAWYINGEVLDILTQNPEVWKKRSLYLPDENDGYLIMCLALWHRIRINNKLALFQQVLIPAWNM